MSFEQKNKRSRPILVCNNCHKKKKKCDRNLPCANCIKLNIDSTCAYSNNNDISRTRKEKNLTKSKSSIENEDILTFNPSVSQKIEKLNNKIKDLKASIAIATLRNNNTSNTSTDGEIKNLNGSSVLGLLAVEPTDGFENSLLCIGKNPVDSEDQTINFLATFHGTSDGRVRAQTSPLGPLRFLVLLREDPCGIMTWKFLVAHALKKLSLEESKGEASSLPNQTLENKSRNFYGRSYIKKIEKGNSISDIIEMKSAISNFGLNLGISLYPGSELWNDTCLADQIKHILPSRKIIWLLVNRFFDCLYPFFPILDENTFRSCITRIIGEDVERHEEKGVETVKLGNMKDIFLSAILLIVLRLSYLSLLGNNAKKNEFRLNSEEMKLDSESQILLNNPIPLETLSIVELCINEFGCIKEPTLELFQALAIIQIYRTYAPEEDTFGRFESAISIGNLYQMANSLFLNRDPDCLLYLYESNVNEETKMLRRRLWYYLINADIEDSIVYGTPIHTSESDFDTKTPYIPEGAQNIFDLDKERLFILNVNELNPIITAVHKILQKIYKVKSDMKIFSLAEYLSDFELLVQNSLGHLNEYLVAETEFDYNKTLKIQKFRLNIYCKIMLLYIYYGFYLYYEKRKMFKFSLFYLKKLIAIIFYEMAGISKEFLYSADEYFGRAFALTATPILQVFNRMEAVLIQFQIRINCTLRMIKNKLLANKIISSVHKDLYLQRLNNICDLLKTFEAKNGQFISSLSSRYYYSWKVKSLFNGSNILFGGIISLLDESITNEAALNFSLNELGDLESLLSICLDLKAQANNKHSKNMSSHKNFNEYKELSDPEKKLMNDAQIDRLWKYIEIYRQELNSSFKKNVFARIGGKVSSVNQMSLADDSGLIGNIHTDVLHEDFIYRNLLSDDFFFDNNFNAIS